MRSHTGQFLVSQINLTTRLKTLGATSVPGGTTHSLSLSLLAVRRDTLGTTDCNQNVNDFLVYNYIHSHIQFHVLEPCTGICHLGWGTNLLQGSYTYCTHCNFDSVNCNLWTFNENRITWRKPHGHRKYICATLPKCKKENKFSISSVILYRTN